MLTIIKIKFEAAPIEERFRNITREMNNVEIAPIKETYVL